MMRILHPIVHSEPYSCGPVRTDWGCAPPTPHRSPRQAFGGNSWNPTEDGRFETIALSRQKLNIDLDIGIATFHPLPANRGSKDQHTESGREARSHRSQESVK